MSMKRQFLLMLLTLSVGLFSALDAQAGRRSIRIDLGAWLQPVSIPPYVGESTGTCSGAGVYGSPNPPQYGWVSWNGYFFKTYSNQSLLLDQFYCQHARAYSPVFDPSEYLNESIFPPDEDGLAYMIGDNLDNSVSAVRYSFLDNSTSPPSGRQWTFYFFPNDLTVVALYGVPDDGSLSPGEGIYKLGSEWIWWEETDGFTGQYFCFQGDSYIGDCVGPPPPPPEEIFISGFESP